MSFKYAVKHTLTNKLNRKTKRKRLVKELKSTATSLSIKQYFLKNLFSKPDQNWRLYSVVLDKMNFLERQSEKINENAIYNLLSKTILENVNFFSANKNIQFIVDSCKAAKERKIFNEYLMMNLKHKLSVNINLFIKHEASHNNAGLQAVDLFCSGIARKYSANDTSWYDMYKNKILLEKIYKAEIKKTEPTTSSSCSSYPTTMEGSTTGT